MILMDEREIDGEAAQLFERALEMAPDNARALWYGGIVAYRRGDMALAQQRWIELQDHDLPADLRQVLAERLAEIERTEGKPAANADAAPPTSAIDLTVGHRSRAGGPRSRERDPVRDRAPWQRRPTARGATPSGRAPGRFRCDSATPTPCCPASRSPAPARSTLVARISLSGQPIASSGDLFGEVGYDFASARPASLTINRTVP